LRHEFMRTRAVKQPHLRSRSTSGARLDPATG
jgi:hypothetical protein